MAIQSTSSSAPLSDTRKPTIPDKQEPKLAETESKMDQIRQTHIPSNVDPTHSQK